VGRILIPVAVVASAVSLSVAASAASGPPVGKYWCAFPFDGDRTFGQLQILTASTYRWSSGKSGAYAGTSSRITFTRGPLAGVYAHARFRTASGLKLIELYDRASFGHSYDDVRCTRRTS
jgi:hypothetical protein